MVELRGLEPLAKTCETRFYLRKHNEVIPVAELGRTGVNWENVGECGPGPQGTSEGRRGPRPVELYSGSRKTLAIVP